MFNAGRERCHAAALMLMQPDAMNAMKAEENAQAAELRSAQSPRLEQELRRHPSTCGESRSKEHHRHRAQRVVGHVRARHFVLRFARGDLARQDSI